MPLTLSVRLATSFNLLHLIFHAERLSRSILAHKNVNDGNIAGKQKIAAGIFFRGKMGDLVGILLASGGEHALADLSRAVVVLVERGKISVVPSAAGRMATTLAGVAGIAYGDGADALGRFFIARLNGEFRSQNLSPYHLG
ncbi:MAG: hypothetical protein ONA90_08860 [candidate division KSB1 bacterium]|nr:hypothetical protein [candidate division KSB1 bacterium]